MNSPDPNEPASVTRHRTRLTRKVREAYNKIDKWEQIHKRRMEDLRVFNLRFPKEKHGINKDGHASKEEWSRAGALEVL